MIEILQCPHGGGPLHLLVDLWWVFVICVPGLGLFLTKMKIKVRDCFCCKGHDKKCCDHECEKVEPKCNCNGVCNPCKCKH